MFNSAAVGNFASRRACSPDFLSDPISCPFFRGSAMSCAMSVERRHAAYDERRDRHQDKKTQRLEFSGHDLGIANHVRFSPATFCGNLLPELKTRASWNRARTSFCAAPVRNVNDEDQTARPS
jgi:hypothetical protein